VATDLTGKTGDERLKGASALVLSGELTEGVSDLSEAMTAPGGVPALREVNQDRSHPDAPLVEEQPPGNYRRLVHGTPGGQTEAAWDTVSPSSPRGPVKSGFPVRMRASKPVAEQSQAARKPT
jgi:hypothetical protein